MISKPEAIEGLDTGVIVQALLLAGDAADHRDVSRPSEAQQRSM